MASEHKKFMLFKSLIVVGFALAIVLLFQTITTYNYVAGALLTQEIERESQHKVNALVGAVRSAQTQDMDEVSTILQELHDEWSDQVAWVRILDATGKPLASAGIAPVDPVSRDKLQGPFPGQPIVPEARDSERGAVLVSIRNFRSAPLGPGGDPTGGRGGAGNRAGPSGFGGTAPTSNITSFQPPPGSTPAPDGSGRGQFPQGPRGGRGPRGVFGANWHVELAIFPDSVSGSFAGLRRNLVVGVSASLTLMTALLLLAWRFPKYLRGQHIERELDLARRVQADLLPSNETIAPYVDFSAECISAWQVGGDFCDVFQVAEDRTALVLGDVSGKGISAALLMALIHGAIHSVAWTRSTQDHVNASRQLNSLLCKKTAAERFASLFWGCFDPQRSTIQYINAGHLPPLLMRATESGPQIHRLESGGPVMGLLPGATFQQGEQYVAPGDILVVFSDGVVEAENPQGEDFGERRVIEILEGLAEAPASEIRMAIQQKVREFSAGVPVGDDQTIIVVRFNHHAAELPETQTSEAKTV